MDKSSSDSKPWTSIKRAVAEFRKHGLASMPTRYIIVLLSSFTNAISYTMRTNLNITIIAMVKNTGSTSNYDTCLQSNQTYVRESDTSGGDFEWSESIQGVVLGAYYYGYIITTVIGGLFADWIGPRWLIGFSVMMSGFLTLIIPVCSQWSVSALIVIRIITGLVQGVLTPSMYTMFGFWIPEQERATAFAVLHVGGIIGTVLTMPLAAFLIQNGFAGGWPSVFYVFGTAGCLCSIPWIYEIYNSPAEHPRIKGSELIYIQSKVNVSDRTKKKSVPWRSILTSKKVWAVVISKFCTTWGFLFLMTKLPDYLESILHFSIDENGMVNALVYISFSASLMLFGYVSDFVEKKKLFSRTVSRKLFQSIGLVGAAAFMALIPVVGCDQTSVIAFLISGMIVLGLLSGGDAIIVVDIAPDYSGSLYGYTNAFASLPGFLAPLFVGLILDADHIHPMTQWNILFWVASGFSIMGAIVFSIFISAKPEPWGMARTEPISDNNNQNNII